ncbi:MAG: hypothetical protein JWP14_1304, partial [Frankiales bacterium]|nr:hypothetical protein [Frankiales bacterium]
MFLPNHRSVRSITLQGEARPPVSVGGWRPQQGDPVRHGGGTH